jgi:ferritin-like metal-binding protein YciE
MRFNTLNELFIDQLRDLYSAENQIVEALPKMASATTSSELRQAFEQHLQQTRGHVDRLNRIFQELNVSHDDKVCKGMQGLITEGEEIMQQGGQPAVMDAALIAAAQRVEHYEIAGYGTARTYAGELGYDDAADLLQDTLDEELETDEKLTDLAEGGLFSAGINEEARQT